MKTLVVYESFFGNTEKIARTIGRSLESRTEVRVVQAADMSEDLLTDVDLLIVGSPTRKFKPTPETKMMLDRIPRQGLTDIHVAAFDTRAAAADIQSRLLRFLVQKFGYAAEPIMSILERRGGIPTVAPAGFLVQGTEGPLKENEAARAAEWAQAVLAASA